MRFKWIIFDADGTLFDYDTAEINALTNTFHHFGYPFEDEYLEIYRQLNKILWLDFEQGRISIPHLKIERFKLMLDELGISAEPGLFSETYLQQLSFRHELIDGAESLLEALAGKIGMMLMTNGIKEVQRSRLKLSSIAAYFSHVIISEEVGAAKPDKMIFEIALAKIAEADKRTILMVGDNLSSDIRGGSDFGLQTCWYNPDQKKSDLPIRPTYQISDLREIITIIRD
jgi:YjjG family noncanonical pyrimidine nucleotidase